MSFDIQILFVFSEFTYNNNCSVRWNDRVEKTPRNKQTQKNGWYSSGYCKLQFCDTCWTTDIIRWCFKDMGISLSIECVISSRGRRADMLLGDRVLKKWCCNQVANILSQIWKHNPFVYTQICVAQLCVIFSSAPQIQYDKSNVIQWSMSLGTL